MGMPTSALSAVAATATCSDSRRAEMLSGLTMGVLGARVVCHARSPPGPEPEDPLPDAGRRWLEPVPGQHGLALTTHEQIDEGGREGGLPGPRHDRGRVLHGAIGILGRPERFLHGPA